MHGNPVCSRTQGTTMDANTHYVWGRLLAENHTLASLANLKAFFSSDRLAVVNGDVVEVKADVDKDADLDLLEGVSESDGDDVE